VNGAVGEQERTEHDLENAGVGVGEQIDADRDAGEAAKDER